MKLAFAVLMFAACSDDKPTVAVTAGNICDQVAQVACYDMYRCCDDAQIELQLSTSSVPTQDQCKSDVSASCMANPELGKLADSVAAGHMTFNSSALTTCLQAMLEPGTTCVVAEVPPWLDACMASAWTGTVLGGDPCAYDRECADAASYCGTAMNVCVPKPHAGQACNPGGCAPGTYCMGSTCMTDTAHGAPCVMDAQCGANFYCATDGSCQPTPVTTTTDYCQAAGASTMQIP